jgi:hypothetical protein
MKVDPNGAQRLAAKSNAASPPRLRAVVGDLNGSAV